MTQIKDILRQAMSLERSGRLEEAARMCHEIVLIAPDNLPARILLGRSLRRQGKLAPAEQHLRIAYKLAPQAPHILSELGSLSLAKSDPNAAVSFFMRLVEIRDDNADAHFNLAHALEQAEQFDDAIDRYQIALQCGARDEFEVLSRIGSAQLMVGDVSAALENFRTALEQNPEFAPALFGRGMAQASLGYLDEASASFSQATAIDPAFTDAWQQIAESKKFSNPEDPDFAALKRVLKQNSDNPEAAEKLHFALGKACNDLKDYDTAFSHFEIANRYKRERLPRFNAAELEERISKIIRFFDSGARFFESPAAPDRPTLIFIVGLPRSGTTLIEQILSGHSRIVAAGENPELEKITRTILSPYPQQANNMQAIEQARLAYYESLHSDARRADFVTDKYPANFMHCGLIRRLFPDARIVHARRTAADTCLSIFCQDFPTGNYYANDLGDIAAYHRQYHRIMDFWYGVMPDSIFDVDYEDLTRDAGSLVRGLLEFLRLPFEESCIDYRESRRPVSTLSRWQVRQPIYRHSVGRWRNYEKHLQPLLQLLKS